MNYIMKKILLAVIALLSFTTGSDACTNLIVGKKASADGSVIVSYNNDAYGFCGFLRHYPAATYSKGTMVDVYDIGSTGRYLGKIPQVEQTCNVVGNLNEHQVFIGETTFGGREELQDSTGIIDYGSLMYLALQRSKTAREAIGVMTGLVKDHGYASTGETFTIADKNEAWVMEMIGKGPGNKGAVWVAVRIPDDCICAHANQSRIHTFALNDPDNCLYSPDVITFARQKGYFNGNDADFDFCEAYDPIDFGGMRFCEARVWSFFRKYDSAMNAYLDYAEGKNKAHVLPFYIKPDRKLSVQDVEAANRDHYEGTPLENTKDCTAGPYATPYRPSPLTYSVGNRKYFNERFISTPQTAMAQVAQLRAGLPDAIGGILWFGLDDPTTTVYTPVYGSATAMPDCYAEKNATSLKFNWNSAFWVYNWVAEMVYPRYSQMIGDLVAKRSKLENSFFASQTATERQALRLYNEDPQKATAFLTDYSVKAATGTFEEWKQLGTYLIVRYNDQTVRPVDKNGHFTRTKYGLGSRVNRVGYPERYTKFMLEQTGDRYLVPGQEK